LKCADPKAVSPVVDARFDYEELANFPPRARSVVAGFKTDGSLEVLVQRALE